GHELVDRVVVGAVDGRDDVARLEPSLVRRAAGGDRRLAVRAGGLGDSGAAGHGLVEAYADVGVVGVAGGDDLAGDPHVVVRGGGETDAGARALALSVCVVGLDLVAEADHLAGGVDQRAARVAWVDRGV